MSESESERDRERAPCSGQYDPAETGKSGPAYETTDSNKCAGAAPSPRGLGPREKSISGTEISAENAARAR